ncbi:extracellular solute-binding protein [Paenibacillus anseongense]|uniref:extracellular solute-binding protein n=1 Tax=Paenibacillus TaxID=44249 RepID=UPI002DBF7B9E|nr:extracellular solute-binding protein [Paenibacillus anseongense]MEC0267251.1 extracellular solute-binding protein [Paenibacillus anseongense]
MKNIRKVSYSVLSLILVVLLVLTGCSNDTKDGGNSANAKTNSGKIKLTFGHFWVDETASNKLFRQTLADFRKENPNIEVEEQAIPHDPYRVKMTTLGASGELPDLFVANGSMLIDYIPKGLVGTFNDTLEADSTWKNGFLPNSFDEFTEKGNIYGVPTAMFTVHLIYYNKDIFDKVGIKTFPKTWDEYLAAIDILKQNKYIPIAMGNKSNVPVGSTLFGTLADRITGTDWFKAQKEGKAKFTDPEFVQALATLDDLNKKGAFNPDINSIDQDQAHSLYYNKQAAMIVDGAWAVGSLSEQAPEDVKKSTGLAVLPQIPGGKGSPNAVAGGSGWSFAYNAKLDGAKKEAAMKLIKKLSDESYGKQQIEINDQPAVKVSNYDKSKLSPLGQQYREFISDKTFTPIYDIQLAPALVEAIYKGIQDLLAGAVKPDVLAKKIQTVRDSMK